MADIYYYCEGPTNFVTSTTLECASELSSSPVEEIAVAQLTAQLAAIGDFDPVRITAVITIYLVFFITGVSTGIVLRNMRRA